MWAESFSYCWIIKDTSVTELSPRSTACACSDCISVLLIWQKSFEDKYREETAALKKHVLIGCGSEAPGGSHWPFIHTTRDNSCRRNCKDLRQRFGRKSKLTAEKRSGRKRAIRNHLVVLINVGCFVGLWFLFFRLGTLLSKNCYKWNWGGCSAGWKHSARNRNTGQKTVLFSFLTFNNRLLHSKS